MLLDAFPRTYIAIEGYSFGSRGNAVLTMAEIKQSLLLVLGKQRPDFERVLLLQPTTWKSALMGEEYKRGTSKEDVQNYLKRRWPKIENLFAKDHNCYDAYAMAALYERLIMTPKVTNKSIQRLIKREEKTSWR
jgi:hypothetical protein